MLHDDGTRVSFCASATFVFTTPPITLTRNERGMHADARLPPPPGGLAAEFYSAFRDARPPNERDSSGDDFGVRCRVGFAGNRRGRVARIVYES